MKDLIELFPPHKALLHLTHNQHLAYYETVEQAIASDTYRPDDWISDEQRKKSIKTGEVWELQWYPETPVGFYRFLSCDLDDLLACASEVK